MDRREEPVDDDNELLDAAGTLVGEFMAVRSISDNRAADLDMMQAQRIQSDSMLLMQQRGGPRFVTTLVSTGEPLDQKTFMRTLLKTPNVTEKPAQTLFHFHKPRERLPVLKPRSSLLDFTELQHDYMYALAGCSDVSFVQSKVIDDVRESLHVIFGMEKVKIGLWFKNRRPKDSPSMRTAGGSRLTLVSEQRTGSGSTDPGDPSFFMEEPMLQHIRHGQGGQKRPSSSRQVTSSEFVALLPTFPQPGPSYAVDMQAFRRPRSMSALVMNPNPYMPQQQQYVQPQQMFQNDQFMQHMAMNVFPQAMTVDMQQGGQAGHPSSTAQLNSTAAHLTSASAQLASMIQNAQMPRQQQHESGGGGAIAAVCGLSELLSLVNLLTNQGSASAVMETLIVARRRGLSRHPSQPVTPVDYLTDLIVAAASAGATASLGQGSFGGMDFTSLHTVSTAPPLETLKAQIQDELNRQATGVGSSVQAHLSNAMMNGPAQTMAQTYNGPSLALNGSGHALNGPAHALNGSGFFSLGFHPANKPISDENAASNHSFQHVMGVDAMGSLQDYQGEVSVRSMVRTQSAFDPTSAPNPSSDSTGMYQQFVPPMGQFQVLNLAQPNTQGVPVFQSLPLPSSNLGNAQDAAHYLQGQVKQLYQQGP